MDSINIGLVAFPINFLLLLGAMLIGSFVAKRIGRRQNVDVEPLLWRVFIASLIAARLFFVIAYFDMYQSAPLSILNILDGGFSPAAGILAAAAGVIWYAWRVREGRPSAAGGIDRRSRLGSRRGSRNGGLCRPGADATS